MKTINEIKMLNNKISACLNSIERGNATKNGKITVLNEVNAIAGEIEELTDEAILEITEG